MKMLATLVTILALLVVFGLWTNHSLQTSTDDLTRQIDLTAEAIKNGRWEQAARSAAKLEKTWTQEAGWWPVLLDHHEIDNIEFSLARVKEYVLGRNPSLSLGQLAELRLMIKHIPKKEAVTLENIL